MDLYDGFTCLRDQFVRLVLLQRCSLSKNGTSEGNTVSTAVGDIVVENYVMERTFGQRVFLCHFMLCKSNMLRSFLSCKAHQEGNIPHPYPRPRHLQLIVLNNGETHKMKLGQIRTHNG